MPMDISARTVSAVLHALQEISGSHYDRLLDHAGWARFRAGIPAESDALIATRAELESLFAQVYLILGEGLTRLFLRNYGRSAARQALSMATRPRWRAAAAATPPEQRLTWFAEAMLQMTTRSWTPTTLTADAQAYYFTFERCPTVCRHPRRTGAALLVRRGHVRLPGPAIDPAPRAPGGSGMRGHRRAPLQGGSL